MNYEKLEGYQEALLEMEHELTRSIRENHGATTPLQILNVFNRFTFHLYKSLEGVKQELKKYEPVSEKEEMMLALEELAEHFPNYTFQAIKEEF